MLLRAIIGTFVIQKCLNLQLYMFIDMFETLLNVGNEEYLYKFQSVFFLKSSSDKMILCNSSD